MSFDANPPVPFSISFERPVFEIPVGGGTRSPNIKLQAAVEVVVQPREHSNLKRTSFVQESVSPGESLPNLNIVAWLELLSDEEAFAVHSVDRPGG